MVINANLTLDLKSKESDSRLTDSKGNTKHLLWFSDLNTTINYYSSRPKCFFSKLVHVKL